MKNFWGPFLKYLSAHILFYFFFISFFGKQYLILINLSICLPTLKLFILHGRIPYNTKQVNSKMVTKFKLFLILENQIFGYSIVPYCLRPCRSIFIINSSIFKLHFPLFFLWFVWDDKKSSNFFHHKILSFITYNSYITYKENYLASSPWIKVEEF